MDPRVLEVKDITTVIEDKDSGSARNAFQDEAFDCMKKCATSANEKQGITGGDNGDFLNERAKRNAENPEVQEAYKQMLEATKDLDPKLVEESLQLASDLAESGLAGKLPGLAKAAGEMKPEAEAKAAAEGSEDGLVDPRISGAWQTILRKFTNPLVIKDVVNIGKDLAQIAMSPQGRALIADIRSLVKHFKEA